MEILGIIPARYGSTRFPGKPLAMIDGRSMIRRVYEQSLKSDSLTKVIVATDDARIFDHVKSFSGEVIMTSPHHPNGTSRCQEVSGIVKVAYPENNFEAVINIQGDEPYIDPLQIDQVASLFADVNADIVTLVRKITDKNQLFDPNVVKVVLDQNNHALYFSRQTIPLLRDENEEEWISKFKFFKHIGIYGYRTKVLGKIVKLEPGLLEKAEKLEQLRWLENGFNISVGVTNLESIAIDTPDDLLKLSNSN